MRTKKMTISYWNSLELGSRKRALSFVFGYQKFSVELYADEKPNLNDSMWRLIFSKVRIPADHSHYKTVVNQTYIP